MASYLLASSMLSTRMLMVLEYSGKVRLGKVQPEVSTLEVPRPHRPLRCGRAPCAVCHRKQGTGAFRFRFPSTLSFMLVSLSRALVYFRYLPSKCASVL